MNFQASFVALLDRYCKSPEKLANLGSTQSNESFNKSVSAKAPKSRFYGGSKSLGYLTAAAVAQKNKGYNYTVDVNTLTGLSPGVYTRRLATLKDIQSRKRRAVAITREAKLRRITLKSNRKQKSSACEVREGTTYETNADFDGVLEENITEIPPPVSKPESDCHILDKGITRIYFDIEATGLSRTSHITQVSALRGRDVFSTYILPACEVSPKAAEITGLTFQNGCLYLNGNIVPAVNVKSGLGNFITFLEKSENNVIFGHNIFNYDCPVLCNALENCSLLEKFERNVLGFVDTLKLFKNVYPGLGSYSQSKLCKELLDLTYGAHDAEEDVTALQRLVCEKVHEMVNVKLAFQSKNCIFYQYSSLKQLHKNLPSLKLLTDSGIISSRAANTIARSGLNFYHLKLAFSRNGRSGIKDVFTEQCGSTVRVTKSDKIISSVSDFFQKM